MSPEVAILAQIVGPLVGAGAGTFFGLKSSLNGLRERSARMETALGEVRDYARDTARLLDGYTKDGRDAMHKLDRLCEGE